MGAIERISGPLVVAKDMLGSSMYDVVRVGTARLIGEIIKLEGERAVIQVYEDTSGVRPGEKVVSTNAALSVELGPGILSQIFDGVQRPLDLIKAKSGTFIKRGSDVSAIDRKKRWQFHVANKVAKGTKAIEGMVLGYVEETQLIKHYIMVPPGVTGKIQSIKAGKFRVEDTVAVIRTDRGLVKVSMLQRRPVRQASRFAEKIASEVPLITGQRIIDTLFPVAKGGVAGIPGPFGSGKCVTGDTKILVDGELRQIKEVFDASGGNIEDVSAYERVKNLSNPMRVHSFDGKKIESKPVYQLFRGRTDELVEIKTKSGRLVRLTPVHKLFAVDSSLEIVEKEAGALMQGEYIIMPRKLDFSSNYQKVSIEFDCRIADTNAIRSMRVLIDEYLKSNHTTKKELAKLLEIDYGVLLGFYRAENRPTLEFIRKVETLMGRPIEFDRIKVGSSSGPLKVVREINEEFGELLGLLMSDGMIRGRSSVVFFNNEKALLERVAYLLDSLFGLKAAYKWQRTVNGVEVHNRGLVKLLLSLGYPPFRKSRNLKLPKGLLNSPDSVLLSFLKAYISGDGALGEKVVEITTASREMRDGLCYVLLRLGVLFRTRERKIGDWIYNRIFISAREAAKLYPQYQKPSYFNSTDIVPMTPELFRVILNGAAPYTLEKQGIVTAGYYAKQNFTTQVFQKVAHILGGEKLMALADALDYVFIDKVVGVTKIKESCDVYDLVVPETHNFIGGNIPMLLHNTVMLHSLAKYSDTSIVVYIGCGERGNEMTEVLTEFPELKDPQTGRPLMERTVLIANTSNMPVAAREASIYTGITIAEYFRDMGYDVALMADSTSRWAEAMREISTRLEEMPGEESYPAYLPKRIAEFYERAGRVKTLGGGVGSITVVGAVSPPGGDLSEPVSQGTLRVIKTFWSLDAALASSRHFPAINWLSSYSLYTGALEKWYDEHLGEGFVSARKKTLALLQREAELKDIVQLVGQDALPDTERVLLEVGRMLREGFLRQSAFDEVDAFTSMKKQSLMIETMLHFGDRAQEAAERGVSAESTMSLDAVKKIARMKEIDESKAEEEGKKIVSEIDSQFKKLVAEQGMEEEKVKK